MKTSTGISNQQSSDRLRKRLPRPFLPSELDKRLPHPGFQHRFPVFHCRHFRRRCPTKVHISMQETGEGETSEAILEALAQRDVIGRQAGVTEGAEVLGQLRG